MTPPLLIIKEHRRWLSNNCQHSSNFRRGLTLATRRLSSRLRWRLSTAAQNDASSPMKDTSLLVWNGIAVLPNRFLILHGFHAQILFLSQSRSIDMSAEKSRRGHWLLCACAIFMADSLHLCCSLLPPQEHVVWLKFARWPAATSPATAGSLSSLHRRRDKSTLFQSTRASSKVNLLLR